MTERSRAGKRQFHDWESVSTGSPAEVPAIEGFRSTFWAWQVMTLWGFNSAETQVSDADDPAGLLPAQAPAQPEVDMLVECVRSHHLKTERRGRRKPEEIRQQISTSA